MILLLVTAACETRQFSQASRQVDANHAGVRRLVDAKVPRGTVAAQQVRGDDVAYNEEVADRVREALANAGVDPVEKKMFGGVAFMVRGHMTVGVVGEELMVRVGKDAHEDALAQPHAREMDFTGKPMTGMIFVRAEGFADDADLGAWVQRGLDFTRSLPPK